MQYALNRKESWEECSVRHSVLVGCSHSFDITQFYYECRPVGDQQLIMRRLEQTTSFKELPALTAWAVVFYAILNNAAVPAWNMTVGSNKYLRLSWRFLMQALLLIPFVLYERRTNPDRPPFTLQSLGSAVSASLSQCLVLVLILTVGEMTFVSHLLILASLQNLFICLMRMKNGQPVHTLEGGGVLLAVFGGSLIIMDSIALQPSEMPDRYFAVGNPFYLHRAWWVRVLGDLGALCASACGAFTSNIRKSVTLGRFTGMQTVYLLNSTFTAVLGFFICGVDFYSLDPQWGWLGLFMEGQWGTFLFMSIIITLGQLITSLIISEAFPETVPLLAAALQPLFSILFVQLVGIQYLPGPIACMGAAFILPGIVLIVLGHSQIMHAAAADQSSLPKSPSSSSQQQKSPLLEGRLSSDYNNLFRLSILKRIGSAEEGIPMHPINKKENYNSG